MLHSAHAGLLHAAIVPDCTCVLSIPAAVQQPSTPPGKQRGSLWGGAAAVDDRTQTISPHLQRRTAGCSLIRQRATPAGAIGAEGQADNVSRTRPSGGGVRSPRPTAGGGCGRRRAGHQGRARGLPIVCGGNRSAEPGQSSAFPHAQPAAPRLTGGGDHV